jgi:hypothetical protein
MIAELTFSGSGDASVFVVGESTFSSEEEDPDRKTRTWWGSGGT